MGSAEVFLAAAIIVIWGALGPRYDYSDTWQLVINTTTTIITFLMVFIIQNTQNRDAKAIQLKLDELIRAVQGARTGLVRLEELSEEGLRSLAGDFEKLRTDSSISRPPTPRHGTSRELEPSSGQDGRTPSASEHARGHTASGYASASIDARPTPRRRVQR
jgi:low affinity Fe/Cu permease